MNKLLNTLIVDDHPIIIDVMKRALAQVSSSNKKLKFNINTANCCDSAELQIKEAKKGLPLDLVFLDISLPPSSNRRLLSGEDLGIKIRQTFNNAKLIVITALNDNHILCNIFKTLNPDGFLIKSDIDNQDVVKAITDVVKNSPYYSKTVTRLIRSHMSSQIVIDQTDREILYHISIGSKMKDLPKTINLSLAGIERRKRHLRDVFDAPKKDDKTLIQRAREKGFI